LLHIFWSCHIVCTAVFRVIIIIYHAFVYTSVPTPITNILELSYSLYGCKCMTDDNNDTKYNVHTYMTTPEYV
jgi:hypothetical protein